MVTTFSYQDLKDVLMDSEPPKIKDPYILIDNPENGNLTVLASGKNSLEYNKTHGFVQSYPGVIVLHCLFGQGLVMMQRTDLEGNVKEVKVVPVRANSSVEIPSGYAYILINTGPNFLVALDNLPPDEKYRDTDSITEHKGLAYYVVEKKGEVAFEANPNYKFHPQLSIE